MKGKWRLGCYNRSMGERLAAYRLTWCALLLVAASGCGGARSAPQPVATTAMSPTVYEADLATLLPQQAVGVLRVSPHALRESPWAEELVFSALARGGDLEGARDFLTRLDEVVLGTLEAPDGESKGPAVVLMRGRFTPEDMVVPGSTTGTHRNHTYRLRETDGTAAVLVDDHTGICGDLDLVRATLDVVDRVAPARGLQSRPLREMLQRVGLRRHDFLWVSEIGAFLMPGQNELLEAAEVVALWVDVDAGLRAGLLLTFSDTSVLPQVEEAVATIVSTEVNNPIMVMSGFASVLEQLQVSVVDDELRAQIALDTDHAVRLSALLQRVVSD